jgi:DNA-binding NarL/FixJ family response regulator
MRILIIEDEPYWQLRIREVVSASESCTIVGLCSNLTEGLVKIKDLEFDVLIVDLGLPDGSGIEAIRAARRVRPEADVVVATVFDDEKSVVSAICAGATGYVLKDSTAAEWLSGITELRAGNSPISPKIARHILRRIQQPSIFLPDGSSSVDDKPTLSSRETEVLRLVAKGFSLVEVAHILQVSHTTARSHAKNIYRKLEVHSRGEAVFEATRMGLL